MAPQFDSGGLNITVDEWTEGDIEVIARAVIRAPSVHNTQPWSLRMEEDTAFLIERRDVALPYHDPRGRDRAISCGTAVANLELAVRALGRSSKTELLPDPDAPELVARVVALPGSQPRDVDLHLFSAIARRRSYRRAFAEKPVSEFALRDLVAAPSVDGVQARGVREPGELTAVANVLEYAAVAVQHDFGYQRELSLWTMRDDQSHNSGDGVVGAAESGSTLPWAGLVRPGTALPDASTLARRLSRESLLVFLTPDDTKLDHIRAGVAAQQAWLTAVDAGLAASVLTQPLHLAEARSSLVERLGLAGYPQLLMRVGYPAGEVPHSPRLPLTQLLT